MDLISSLKIIMMIKCEDIDIWFSCEKTISRYTGGRLWKKGDGSGGEWGGKGHRMRRRGKSNRSPEKIRGRGLAKINLHGYRPPSRSLIHESISQTFIYIHTHRDSLHSLMLTLISCDLNLSLPPLNSHDYANNIIL